MAYDMPAAGKRGVDPAVSGQVGNGRVDLARAQGGRQVLHQRRADDRRVRFQQPVQRLDRGQPG